MHLSQQNGFQEWTNGEQGRRSEDQRDGRFIPLPESREKFEQGVWQKQGYVEKIPRHFGYDAAQRWWDLRIITAQPQ